MILLYWGSDPTVLKLVISMISMIPMIPMISMIFMLSMVIYVGGMGGEALTPISHWLGLLYTWLGSCWDTVQPRHMGIPMGVPMGIPMGIPMGVPMGIG